MHDRAYMCMHVVCVLWCIILHTCSCIMPVFCGARCVHEGFNTLCPCALAHGGACMSMRHVHGHQSSYRRPCGVSCASVCNSRRRDMCMCIGVHAQQCRGFPSSQGPGWHPPASVCALGRANPSRAGMSLPSPSLLHCRVTRGSPGRPKYECLTPTQVCETMREMEWNFD